MGRSIGEKIKELRELRGLTQQQLADQLGCAQTTIAEWENKKDRLPWGKYLPEAAKVLGVSVDYLLGGETPEPPQIPCYGEVLTERFTWSSLEEPEYYIGVPQTEYSPKRFSLKILDDVLEPVAYKGDHCIFEKLPVEDGDVVLLRFPQQSNMGMVRIWRQQDRLIVLCGGNAYSLCVPYVYEINHFSKEDLSYMVMKNQSQEHLIIEGKLVAVKRVVKAIKHYGKISYIFS